ncbi:uncharacterized protein PHACADRAFT_254690 [Phanerochaete carnosa HHB-10118-sp]|uniref:Polysaccharide biosynthesis domain-containing protein n=1 Tax=Phanerochaete carnosa (strain HHB-10118-sp) TaxID=650164 RepID=K5V3G3_PHACS|nr:uncharacterized protein PHACADRAFT_254690 [Phanerochaete carnosa HHB-10118-sp]EKM57116.1 hypothetical protein PHACADRAFT_254690 [Phanerochaete carnosa HHB-10118-sp]
MAAPQNFDPNKAQNMAETYWNLIEKVNPRDLKLTKQDDEIFEHFKNDFPELFVEPYDKIQTLDESLMKSKDGKERWRKFIESYKDTIKDYNFGSLIRTNAHGEYSETNTIFSTRPRRNGRRGGTSESGTCKGEGQEEGYWQWQIITSHVIIVKS